MAAEAVGDVRDLAAGLEKITELRHVSRQVLIVLAAQADVDEVPLAKTPSVALQVGAEEQLRHLPLNMKVLPLARVQLELDFLGGHHRLTAPQGIAQRPGHGTEVPAGPNHQRRLNGVIHHPSPVAAAQRLESFAQALPRAAAHQQVMIELAAANTIADRVGIATVYLVTVTDEAGDKPRNRLEDIVVGIGGDVQMQLVDNRRRNPAGTDLVTGEALLVHDHDVHACVDQGPGQG